MAERESSRCISKTARSREQAETPSNTAVPRGGGSGQIILFEAMTKLRIEVALKPQDNVGHHLLIIPDISPCEHLGKISKLVAKLQRTGASANLTTDVEAGPVDGQRLSIDEAGWSSKLIAESDEHAPVGQLGVRGMRIGLDIFPGNRFRSPIRIPIFDARAPVAVERVLDAAAESPAGPVASQEFDGIRRVKLMQRRRKSAECESARHIDQASRRHQISEPATNAAIPRRRGA